MNIELRCLAHEPWTYMIVTWTVNLDGCDMNIERKWVSHEHCTSMVVTWTLNLDGCHMKLERKWLSHEHCTSMVVTWILNLESFRNKANNQTIFDFHWSLIKVVTWPAQPISVNVKLRTNVIVYIWISKRVESRSHERLPNFESQKRLSTWSRWLYNHTPDGSPSQSKCYVTEARWCHILLVIQVLNHEVLANR